MTREEAKEWLPIIQAWAEDKPIQYQIDSGVWVDITKDLYTSNRPSNYCIKSELKYRPFKSQEECWQEMQKHQPFGWLRNIFTQRLFNIDTISYPTYNIRINDSILDGDDAFNSYTFVDGTPFGIKE